MKYVLKTWSLILTVTFSFHLALAAQIPTHGVPADENSLVSEFDQNMILIQNHINELNSLQESLADVEDTNGLMSAIGQTIDQAEISLKDLRKNLNLKQSRQVTRELSALISEFKATSPLNQILGVHVSSELTF